jgi:NADH-ubiquinone oxidoreductase chain 5
MIILVTANNLLQLFTGWEGVGICSYLLINFWYTRISANKSSIMAVLVNKIGDIALLIAITILFYLYKSFDFYVIYSSLYNNINLYGLTENTGIFLWDFSNNWLSYVINDMNNLNNTKYIIDSIINYSYYLDAVTLLIIIAAVGKSAQVGLHMWLPEAMEGPTPVSSLIHAATMVTAGIFLILRSSYIFELVPNSLLIIVLLGSITCFFASTIGIFQNDLKKVVAYSTCSQLGYMFLACGLSSYSNSMFHLINHAFFKALLFLTAGYIIHACASEQDMRKFGGFLRVLPFAYMMITIGSLSLMGFPFFSGFYSKEKILELFNNSILFGLYNKNIFYFSQFLAYFAVLFTVFYSVRSMSLTFFMNYNGNLSRLYNIVYNNSFISSNFKIHYGSWFMLIPLFLLSILSITSGYLLSDMMLGVGTDFWSHSISFNLNPNISNYYMNNQYNYSNLTNLFVSGISYEHFYFFNHVLDLDSFFYYLNSNNYIDLFKTNNNIIVDNLTYDMNNVINNIDKFNYVYSSYDIDTNIDYYTSIDDYSYLYSLNLFDNFINSKYNYLHNYEFNEHLRGVTAISVLYFMLVSTIFYNFNYRDFILFHFGWIYGTYIFHLLNEKYIFYQKLIVEPLTFNLLKFSYNISYLLIDKGLLEINGPYGMSNFINKCTKFFYLNSNSYIHFILINLFVLINILFLFIL